jgi:hypothetical protein
MHRDAVVPVLPIASTVFFTPLDNTVDDTVSVHFLFVWITAILGWFEGNAVAKKEGQTPGRRLQMSKQEKETKCLKRLQIITAKPQNIQTMLRSTTAKQRNTTRLGTMKRARITPPRPTVTSNRQDTMLARPQSRTPTSTAQSN